MAILGLMTTDSFSSERFTSIRRSVFYSNPAGAAPLVGILSMLKEMPVSDPEFVHYEKRLSVMASATSQANAAGPFTNTSNADLTSGGWTQAAGTTIRVYVVDKSFFRTGHQIKIEPVSGTTTILYGVVTATGSVAGPKYYIDVQLTETATAVLNTTANNGIEVKVVGSTFAQGSLGNSESIYNLPIAVRNYCQIFRTSFLLTGTAMKTPAKFDKSGPYADKAKESALQHMIEMEWAMINGRKYQTTSTESGNVLPQYMTGGIIYWLEQWEAADSPYRGGTGAPAVTLDTDDNKRIINNTSGTLTERQYDGYIERVFRNTSNVANEKLVLCGSGFLNTINQLYKNKAVLMSDLPLTDTYGMDVVKHRSPFGTVYYKSHPLFNQNALWRNRALFLDVNHLEYRYVTDRDTKILANRQPRKADYREDEWLTECGIQVKFPEAHMLIKNVLQPG